MWYNGLCAVVHGLKKQLQLSDRRMLWLKEQYLQLFYEENCCGPMTVDAIRVSPELETRTCLVFQRNKNFINDPYFFYFAGIRWKRLGKYLPNKWYVPP